MGQIRWSLLASALVVGVADRSTAQVVREEVHVVASRAPATATARRVLVIERAEIAALQAQSLADVLATLSGIALGRRGAPGAQADLGLRGATFEQVTVLVNGVRVNDPQTGHFNFDLPIPLETIDRIEVLLGPGSAIHGPDAFGGVIAITTGMPESWQVKVRGGEHRLASGGVSGPLAHGFFASAERTSTAGYRRDTDLSLARGVVGWRGEREGWRLATDGALESKQFGAWAFYSTRYPNQWEATKTALLTASARRDLGFGELTILGGARQHDDHYLLDRGRPAWYDNRHRNRTVSLGASLTGGDERFSWALGTEGERQALTSKRLGDHAQDRAAIFGELGWSGATASLALQARADRMDRLGWIWSPGVGVEARLGRGCTLAGHVGRSFRLPSFTELYYDSPATVGNPKLAAERATTGELTLRAPVARTLFELSAFRRRASDLIDFVRDDLDVYRAANHARAQTDGVEVAATFFGVGRLRRLRISGAWLDTKVKVDPARSRYALAHPRAEAALSSAARLPFGLEGTLGVRVRKPVAAGSYAIVDLGLRRELGGGLAAELEADNLLDRSYEEVPGVPMPPRWVSLALRWRSHAP